MNPSIPEKILGEWERRIEKVAPLGRIFCNVSEKITRGLDGDALKDGEDFDNR